MLRASSLAGALASLSGAAAALKNNNGLNRVPVMGWNTWCTDGICERDVCNETEILGVAHAIKDSGLYDIGYKMIAMDDCWEWTSRDAKGDIQWDASRFPNGLPAMVAQLHALNFSVGIYTSLGYQTCAKAGHNSTMPGSYGSYAQDAATFASWQIDAVKGDWCDTRGLDQQTVTTQMGAALNATGRRMWYNFHCGDSYSGWCAAVGDSSRVWQDHHDSWYNDDSNPNHHLGTSDVIHNLGGMGAHAGLQPDGQTIWWPDWDFLMTGGQGCTNGTAAHCPGMTDVEYRTEFSFWTLASSILLFATDPRDLTPIMKEVLYNTELIAVNQDPVTRAGMGIVRVSTFACDYATPLQKQCELWHRAPGSDGSHYVILYNPNDLINGPLSGPNVTITVKWTDIGLPSSTSAAVRDLWAHADLGSFTGSFTAQGVQPHEARTLKVTG